MKSEHDDGVTVELRQVAKGRWAATVETDQGLVTVESDSIEDLHEYALAAYRAGRKSAGRYVRARDDEA